MTPLQMAIGITMAAAAIALVAWFTRYNAGGTDPRQRFLSQRASL